MVDDDVVVVDDIKARVIDYVYQALDRQAWSVADLARACGVPRTTVYAWLTPTRRAMRSSTICALARGLGVDPGDLTQG